MPIYKKINKDFFKKWSPQMAYVLGFFAADGYITVNRRGGQFWCIQITDKELLYNIRKTIDSEHKISERLEKGNEKAQYRLQIGSVEMCDDLRKLGFNERKTKSMSVPSVPKKYFSDFTRGYFDGDGNVWVGYVHKERITQLMVVRVVFTSCSLIFLETLKQRLMALGIDGGVVRKEKGNYYRLAYNIRGSLKLYDFMYNHNDFQTSNLFLERKRLVFDKYNTPNYEIQKTRITLQ